MIISRIIVHFKIDLKIIPNYPPVFGNHPQQSPFHSDSSILWRTCKLMVEVSVAIQPGQPM